MTILSRSLLAFGIAASSLLAALPLSAYAESAPVYDVDSGSADDEQDQDLPPPPAPGQEGAFVPTQPTPGEGNISTASMSIQQRLRRLEQQITNLQSSSTSTQVESLQGQLQALRNQVEQLTHDVQQLQNQQKAMFIDIDKRLGQSGGRQTVATVVADSTGDVLNPAVGARFARKAGKSAAKAADEAASVVVPQSNADGTPTEPTPKDNQPDVAEEQQIYQTAYNLIKAKKYDNAVTTLQNMLKKYPSGQFASNAHYWLGELYGLMGKNDQAAAEFLIVVRNYPDSPRVSDALLKVGLIYAAQSKWSDAKSTFRKVINTYPGTGSSRVAAEQLKQIKQAGH